MSEQDDEQYLTTEEALAFLGIKSRNTLKGYVDDGLIKKYKARIGRARYRLSELRELKQVKPVGE